VRALIRQTIACDICGAEKKETNHWFIAVVQRGELRLTNWETFEKEQSRSKHLCGQTCLHRLVDEFVAGRIGGRVPAVVALPEGQEARIRGEGLDEFESSARLTSLPQLKADVLPLELKTVRSRDAGMKTGAKRSDRGAASVVVREQAVKAIVAATKVPMMLPELRLEAGSVGNGFVGMGQPIRKVVDGVPAARNVLDCSADRRVSAWERERARETEGAGRRKDQKVF